MVRYKLTIAIPTYNRPKQLAHTLSILLPQVLTHDDVQLLILDNFSTVEAHSVLGQVANGMRLPERIQVIRHSCNIGGDANIIRSFEVAEGDWLWCSSDDDEPASDAVEVILRDCNEGRHCYAYYGLKMGVPDVADCVDGRFLSNSIKEWVRRVPSYGFRLFISESVFKVSDMRPYMSLAHLVACSGAAHLVMAYCAVSNGGLYLLSSRQISRYNVPEGGVGYNFSRLAYGTPSLSIVKAKGDITNYKLFFEESYKNWISPSMFLSHALLMYRMLSPIGFYRQFALISSIMKPLVFRHPINWLKWTVCQLLSVVPSLARKCLKV